MNLGDTIREKVWISEWEKVSNSIGLPLYDEIRRQVSDRVMDGISVSLLIGIREEIRESIEITIEGRHMSVVKEYNFEDIWDDVWLSPCRKIGCSLVDPFSKTIEKQISTEIMEKISDNLRIELRTQADQIITTLENRQYETS